MTTKQDDLQSKNIQGGLSKTKVPRKGNGWKNNDAKICCDVYKVLMKMAKQGVAECNV